MANEEHLAILRLGVWQWNKWREENPDVRPDLSHAELQKPNRHMPDFRGTIFARRDFERIIFEETKPHRAHFEGANFHGVDLSEANLYAAILDDANLQDAILYGANLRGVSFRDAKLQGALVQKVDLTESHLIRTNFYRADLCGVNLSPSLLSDVQMKRAKIGGTIFANVDLRDIHGLDTLYHVSPSHIGIETLYKSRGQIPEVFLRGCGVPDSMIEYARSLVAAERPIDYYSCFISYSSHDDALAERLYADLQAKGVRCWLAPHDLTPGEVIVRGIDEAIRLHDKVVLLLSEAAVLSPWVKYEVDLACTCEAGEGRTMLYPLRLDDAVLTTAQDWAVMLRKGRHIGDFRQWKDHNAYQAMFARLLRDLKAEQQ
ncbi:MAG TPA: toll/interleukin-1 receptor domain-containing protein [Herpetosiphonaceae bacterium]